MKEQAAIKAETLAQALPYIQQFHDKVVVIKYGGNAMVSPRLFDAVMEDVILLTLVGIRVVLVHGGGPDINDMLQRVGKEAKFVGGLRYTDEETMEVVQSVLCGKVNKNLVATINRMGGRAVGLSGMDAGLFQARQLTLPSGEDLGLVGEIYDIDPDCVFHALDDGYIPVIASVALGLEEDRTVTYNVNADTAAAMLAMTMGAEKLILLTDAPGVLRDQNDPNSLISKIERHSVDTLLAEGSITGGMIPKLECCAHAVASGVERAHIIDGRVPHAILVEMLTDEGFGTMVY
jgi:acetylglutamate kinase